MAVVAGAWVSARSPLVRATAVQALLTGQHLARGSAHAGPRRVAAEPGLTAAGWGRGRTSRSRAETLVLVTVDALRADRLAAMGGRGRTPTLDALARRGMTFRRAYATTPHTFGTRSRRSCSARTRAPCSRLRQGPPRRTLADFSERGYATAGFLPPAVFSVDAEHFGALADTRFGFAHRVEDWSSAADRVDQALRWTRERRAGERVFLWVHLFELHEPYDAHPEFPSARALLTATTPSAPPSTAPSAASATGSPARPRPGGPSSPPTTERASTAAPTTAPALPTSRCACCPVVGPGVTARVSRRPG
ncbi:MAG: sulfatase-like hydrolase/transferase [Polyangiales bacterium]